MVSSSDILNEKSNPRASGRRSRAKCDGKKLPFEKEKKIAKIVEGMREIGHKPTNDCIRGFAHSEISQVEKSDIYVSKKWYDSLREHYPEIDRDSNLFCDYRRALNRRNCIKAAELFFNVLQTELISSIPPERRYSMNALGWFLVDRPNEKNGESRIALNRLEVSRLIQEKRNNKFGNWVTCIECISATGESLPSTAIFPNENIRKKYDKKILEKSKKWRTMSLETEMKYSEFEYGDDKNVIECDIFRKWARDVFFPETEPKSILEPRLLLLDAERSDEKKLIVDCLKNNVIVIYLPPWDKGLNFNQDYLNTPINVAFFDALRSQYLDSLESIDTNTSKIYISPKMIDYNSFFLWYQKVKKNFTGNENYRSIIIFAFKLTGLWPLNLEYSSRSLKFTNANNSRENSNNPYSPESGSASMDSVPSLLWDLDWEKKDVNQSLKIIDEISLLIRSYTKDDQKKSDISQNFAEISAYLKSLSK